MPSGLPDQRPDGSEKPKDEERQRNYTPQNELGLPASKFTERVSEEALEDATGSWEKPSPETGEDVGRVSSRSVQIVGMGFAVFVALVILIAFTCFFFLFRIVWYPYSKILSLFPKLTHSLSKFWKSFL